MQLAKLFVTLLIVLQWEKILNFFVMYFFYSKK